MVFSSLPFLLGFMPVFFILYYLLPDDNKNPALFLGSVIFYGVGTWGHPLYLLFLLCSMAVNIRLGQRIRSEIRRRRRILRPDECRTFAGIPKDAGRRYLYLGLLWNFGILFFFKYMGFVGENLNRLLPDGLAVFPTSRPELPPGISFFTFQVVSYLIDLCRGADYEAKASLSVGTYLCMFPQLIAGPIITYKEVEAPLCRRRHSLPLLDRGLREFSIGLGFKVLLANRIGGLWREVNAIGYESLSTPLAWMGIAAFSFQLYFDFYGYSLMARGLGFMLGMRFPVNFSYPYTALTMTDFWRRWHMTLGQWFRDYVYIPLGGSREGRGRTFRNLLIVWLLTGIWHGASWNYLLWGLLLFLLIALEKLGLKKIFSQIPLLGHLYMLLAIPLTWLVFAVTDLRQIPVYLGRLFGSPAGTGAAVFSQDYIKYGRIYGLLLIVCLVFCTPLPRRLYDRYSHSWPVSVGLLAVFWLSVFYLYIGLNDPFLYSQF
ncbi:MAG: MBOAT family protein [Lachnospiraceae bacterium]|jgi:alginate O-acetyltransferase complex protein AlgI|nr:MBOAT family protein [Lachnospiraceae bacterium]